MGIWNIFLICLIAGLRYWGGKRIAVTVESQIKVEHFFLFAFSEAIPNRIVAIDVKE